MGRAVQHADQFSKPKDAWEHYGSSRQRFYEWKRAMRPQEQPLDAAAALLEALGAHGAIDGDLGFCRASRRGR